MPKSVCANCEVELKPETNGVIVVEMMQENTAIYKLWEADLWKCSICGIEVVIGFAAMPFAMGYEGNCENILEEAKAAGKRIIYDKEML